MVEEALLVEETQQIFESQMTGLMDALSDAQPDLRDLKVAIEQLKADSSHRH